MRRSLVLFALGSASCLGAWSAYGRQAPPITAIPASTNQFGYEGSIGCAAAGCHNNQGRAGEINRPGAAGNEYTTWVHDPHLKAYQPLTEPRSERMVRAYRRDPNAVAYKDTLCLSCHSTAKVGGPVPEENLREEGVGCEACHGAASGYKTVHYQSFWAGLSPAQKKAFGLTDTKNLTTRIEMCVGCHVGNAEKEVNHDLLAAGHPRLAFDYASFHNVLPRHWRDKAMEAEPFEACFPQSKPKFGNDFELRIWALGQVATARAAVDLLRERAEAEAANPKRPKFGMSVPWPEFAEASCYSCHRDLSDKVSDNYKGGKPKLAWGTWYTPEVAELVKAKDLVPGLAPPMDLGFDEIRKAMEPEKSFIPDAGVVAAKAKDTVAALDAWIAKLEPRDGFLATPAQVESLFRSLTTPERIAALNSWDSAAQHFLALAAVYHARGDMTRGPGGPAREEQFSKLRKLLEFPKDAESPRGFDKKQNLDDYKAVLTDVVNQLGN